MVGRSHPSRPHLTMNEFTRAANEMAARNAPLVVARAEAHHLTYAGLSPVYCDPGMRDWYVQGLLRGEYQDTALMSRENRARVAAAAIRGWVTTHG